MKKRILAGLVTVGLVLAGGSAAAALNGIAVEAGSGDDISVGMGRVALQWDWDRRWFQGEDWHIGGYWDLGLGYWKHDPLPGRRENITEIGFTPVFRLQRNDLTGPYVELAVGLHLLSRTQIGDKRMSSSFQFGDHIGIGYRFGAKAAWDLAYRFQHLSNGGIGRPNDGIEFHQVRLQYHF